MTAGRKLNRNRTQYIFLHVLAAGARNHITIHLLLNRSGSRALIDHLEWLKNGNNANASTTKFTKCYQKHTTPKEKKTTKQLRTKIERETCQLGRMLPSGMFDAFSTNTSRQPASHRYEHHGDVFIRDLRGDADNATGATRQIKRFNCQPPWFRRSGVPGYQDVLGPEDATKHDVNHLARPQSATRNPRLPRATHCPQLANSQLRTIQPGWLRHSHLIVRSFASPCASNIRLLTQNTAQPWFPSAAIDISGLSHDMFKQFINTGDVSGSDASAAVTAIAAA